MMSQQCNVCLAYFTGNEAVCSRCGTPRGMASAAQVNQQPYAQQGQIGPQCSTCGAYYTGNEQVCLRCNTPRGYGQMNQGQFNNQFDPLLLGAGAIWAGRSYTPQRAIRRWIVGRLIGWAIALSLLLICGAIFFIALLSGLAGRH